MNPPRRRRGRMLPADRVPALETGRAVHESTGADAQPALLRRHPGVP
jgi:hypothetical protein